MIKFPQDAYESWKKARTAPECPKIEKPEWVPKFPLNHKLPGANGTWSERQWDTSGFPSSQIPDQFPTMLKEEAWDALLEETERAGLLSLYHKKELIKIKSWLLEGIPFRMTGPGTEPEKARHHLNCRETERAVDKIAQFCAQGHMAGPLHSRKTRNDLKFTSIFARYQQSDNSVRITNDHSYPKGRAFNEAIDSKVVEEIPIHVGQLREFIKSVLECGKNAIISKYDMNAAYKFIPVKREQYRLQTILICGAIFVDMKLSFGDATSYHYYSFFHTIAQEAFVFSIIDTPRDLVTICVDDSSIVVPQKAYEWAVQYGDRYKKVMDLIGAGTKPPDPKRRKCFELKTDSEVLGVWINTTTLKWSLSKPKLSEILQKIDSLIDPIDSTAIKVVKLKEMQAVVGKIVDLAMICSNLKSATAIINIEKARFEKEFHDENKIPLSRQLKIAFLSPRAKEDMLVIRSVLACIQEHPIELENHERCAARGAQLFFCADASGLVADRNAPAALGVYIPQHGDIEALALSYILPRKWLLSRNEGREQNADNTVLLELLALISPIVKFPHIFRSKAESFQTDNLALAQLYKSLWPNKEGTAYFMRALNFVTQASIEWKRRRSDLFSRIADDLTHSRFGEVPMSCQNRRVSTLPDPILKVLTNSCKNVSNDYHKIVLEVTKCWEDNDISFNRNCLY